MTNVDANLATMAAEAIDVVAKQVRRSGDGEAARRLIRQAADIELMSTDLQNCWGGPFNGQAGRLSIVQELLTALAPQVVVETGTFRGISTLWFAQNFSGSVLSCEAEERNLIQAEHRLEGCRNVELSLSDSRAFLRSVVPRLDPDRPAFFYLDAHWKQDLPLNEELRIIFGALPRAVVMVDDFRIPDDPGYGWDDYGPGVKVDTSALEGALPPEVALFVPRLAAANETGAKRGCCIIAWRMGETVDQCQLLRRRSLCDLAPSGASEGDLRQDRQDDAAIVPDLDGMSPSALMIQISALNKDRAQRLQDVALLSEELAVLKTSNALLETASSQRLRDVISLTEDLAALKTQRSHHLRDIASLTEEVHRLQTANAELETACVQRLQDVHTLAATIQKMQLEGRPSL